MREYNQFFFDDFLLFLHFITTTTFNLGLQLAFKTPRSP